MHAALTGLSTLLIPAHYINLQPPLGHDLRVHYSLTLVSPHHSLRTSLTLDPDDHPNVFPWGSDHSWAHTASESRW